MKNLKNFILCILCLATASFSLTSCLGDDDDDDTPSILTPAERAQQMNAMQGIYNGYVYYNDYTAANGVDSLATSWNVTAPDSTLNCPAFPVKCFANCLSETDSDAKAILLAAQPQRFNAEIRLFPYKNEQEGYYFFYLFPKEEKMSYTVELEEVSHTVVVTYTASSATVNGYGQTSFIYCTGGYYKSGLNAYVIVGNINIDYKDYNCSNLSNGANIFLLGGQK